MDRTLAAQIQAAYPDADPARDYELRDDGHGPYLAAWHIAGPLPAGVRLMETAFTRWWRASVALCRSATVEIIDKTATPERNRATGGVDALIAAAAPGAEVAPGVTREQAEEMAALWDWFNGAARTALADPRAHGKTPIQILSELGGA